MGTKWNELHLVRNVFGCPLKIGVYIDQCTDIGRIENVHFNPNFWTRMALKPGFPGGDIKAYLEKNLVGFKIGKTDWEFISNSFVIFPQDRLSLRRLRPRARQRGDHPIRQRHLPGGGARGPHATPRRRAVRQRAVHVHRRDRPGESRPGQIHQLRILGHGTDQGTSPDNCLTTEFREVSGGICRGGSWSRL